MRPARFVRTLPILLVLAATVFQIGTLAPPAEAVPYPATDVPKAIPDEGTAQSFLTVPAGTPPVTDLNLTNLTIAHEFPGDLIVSLHAPGGGPQILVFDGTCGGQDWTQANTGFDIDQEAFTNIGTTCPPGSDSYRPEQSFDLFDGAQAAGTWELRVQDAVASDTGTLISWGLDIDGGSLTVNTTLDIGDSDGVCDSTCTLREAINLANQEPDADTILFNIPGAGPHTIFPTSVLPVINHPLTINGYSQPGSSVNTAANGSNAVLKIQLDGTNLATGDGLNGRVTVRGLTVRNFPGAGIRTRGGTVRGNFVGTDVTGTTAHPNGIGISASRGEEGHPVIGGGALADRNLVSGNTDEGIVVTNGFVSFFIVFTTAAVDGNVIGLNASGTGALPNGTGLSIASGNDHTIGTAAGNVISGNAGDAIVFEDTTFVANQPDNVTITGNRIGTNPAGTTVIANGGDGITGVLRGGLFENNVISGNVGDGIDVTSQVDLLEIHENRIGTAADGTTLLGNGGDGIRINTQGAFVLIGGSTTIRNFIAGNDLRGVVVLGDNVGIFRNEIHSNGALGIDLSPIGVTVNDAGDLDTGANDLQNFPVVTAASSGGGSTHVSATLSSKPNQSYLIQFFASPVCDGSSFGEGRQFLGSKTLGTEGSGGGEVSGTFPASVPDGWVVTATATESANNRTSEFSECRTVAGAADLGVSIADSADPVASGAQVTYTYTVTNHGPSPAPAVALESLLPVGLTEVSTTPSQGDCTDSDEQVSCDLGTLASSASATVTVVAVAGSAGTVSVTGDVSSDAVDTVPTNDQDTETTTISSGARTLTVITQGNGTGSVASVPAGAIACPGDCTQSYTQGTVVTLRATAGSNSVFTGWSGACTNRTGDCTVTMSANRTVRATFLACTVLGTSGNNVLTGTKTTNDVICGLGGNDTLTGLEGNDVLDGGAGNDTLLGGKGSDLLLGGANVDTATFGDSGVAEGVDVDLVARTAFSTTLGNDLFGLDTSTNQADVENIEGSPFADSINGGTANNTLNGKEGDDTIDGGGGNDILTGGDGADELSGDAGNDRIQPGMDTDVAEGGSGADILDYGNGITGGGVLVDLTLQTANEPSANDAISGFESVFGTASDDNLTGSAGVANILTGGLGADTLNALDGDVLDTIAGGADAVNDACSADPGDTVLQCP